MRRTILSTGFAPGPRGTFLNGEVCAHSVFQTVMHVPGGGWQWVAYDPHGAVLNVIEMPFVLATVCDTRDGALWVLREIIASYFHNVRSHRGH